MDGDQSEVVLLEVEVLVLLEDEVELAVERVSPPVVLAHELPARAAGGLPRGVVPAALVAAMPTHVVKRADLLVETTDHDHRRLRDRDVLREEAALARELLDAADVQPGT